MTIDKRKCFESIVLSVEKCCLCNRMCGRKKILSEKNGSLYSKVIFIAEAPGRLGAESTGVPLHGDETGKNFEILLDHIGWKREDIFITNAILCNPQDLNGKNDPPKLEEIKNCSDYLKQTIDIVDPNIIVTLGGKALEALKYIKDHDFELKNCVAQVQFWNNKYLFPLYHISPKVFNFHRNEDKQKVDFFKLSQTFYSINEIMNRKENNNY